MFKRDLTKPIFNRKYKDIRIYRSKIANARLWQKEYAINKDRNSLNFMGF